MAVSFVASLVVARGLFPLYSVNRDDAQYVYEARLLNQGDLTLPAGEHAVFRPWASGVRDGRVVMKYAPPWPAVLAVSERVTGSFLVGPAAVAAAAVGLVYLLARELWRDRRSVALVAAGAFALSPVTLIQSGTYLPYLFQLVTGLAFAVSLLAGLRRGSPRLLALAGVALGVGLFARPYDALLFALPFVAVLAWTQRGRWAELARTAGFVAAGAAPLVALQLLYNTHTMGSPLALPFTVTGPYDTLGFGRRGIVPTNTFRFTFEDGLRGLGTNLRWFPGWAFGGIVTFALAGGALLALVKSGERRDTRSPWTWAVAGVALTVCAGYVLFWSPFSMSRRWPGVVFLGPFYHLPVLVPVVLLAAYGFDALWRGTSRQRGLALAAAGVAVVLTVVALPPKIDVNGEARDRLEAIDRRIDGLHLRDAVMVLPTESNDGFNTPTPFLENRPDLDQPVLYAEDRGAGNIALFDRYGDRVILQLVAQLEPGDELLDPSFVPTRLRLDAAGTAEAMRLDLRFTNVTEQDHVIAYVSDGHIRQERVVDEAADPGEAFPVSWDLVTDQTDETGDSADPADAVGEVDEVGEVGEIGGAGGDALAGSRFAPRRTDAGLLRVGFAVGDGTTGVAEATQRWELRFPYRIVDGQLQLVRPGRGYELFVYGDERHWVPKNLDDLLDDVSGR